MSKPVFLFPAFVLKYLGSEIELIEANSINFNERLRHLSELTGVDLRGFDLEKNNFMKDELRNQLITYLISCIYWDILRSKSVFPSSVTSISMGLYSALYCAGSISFNEGAILIDRIYEFLYEQNCDRRFKMLAVTGFSNEDIASIIKEKDMNLEIVIKNNQYSFIVAGYESSINEFYETAKKEGAIHLNIFPVSIPYHSKFLDASGMLERIFDDVTINNPEFKIISSIDQKELCRPCEIKSEIIKNLNTNIDWHKTMTTLIKMGSAEFIECGPGDSLKRISRFYEEPCKVFPLSKII